MLRSMKDLQILDNINENSFFLNNDSPPKLKKTEKGKIKNFSLKLLSHSYDQEELKKYKIIESSSFHLTTRLEIDYEELKLFQKNFDLLKIQKNPKNNEEENKSDKVKQNKEKTYISTKDQMINDFFSEKKKMEKKLKIMQIEKRAGKKRVIQKMENIIFAEELNRSRKNEFLEKKSKIKKYENMKLKKYKEETENFLDDNEDIQKLELEKKLIIARTKITIKTFLVKKKNCFINK